MASIIQGITAASGGTESAGFLNDIVAQLWPNINIAAAGIAKDVVEPILATTLPGPLSGLKFTKFDLGPVPIRFSNVDTHKTVEGGIKLDMDLDWEGECDMELKATMVPQIGVEHVKLKGRLTILFCPLTNIIPLIGALQVAFINPPSIKLDFTDAANIADCFLIEKTVRNVVLGVISSMAVLPNRTLVKLQVDNDYFKTYQSHHGVVRLRVCKATGLTAPKKGGMKGVFNKIVKDVPDCYTIVRIGAEEWQTKTVKNEFNPVWNETRDFLVMDYEQEVSFDLNDSDIASHDDIGMATTSVKQILLNGGSQDFNLVHEGQPTEAVLSVQAEFHQLVADASLLFSQVATTEEQICGLVTILIAGAANLTGDHDELFPSVKVTWGDKEFTTAEQSHTPGVDIFNPAYDAPFTIRLTSALLAQAPDFRISLLNKKKEIGTVEIPFASVLEAEGMSLRDSFDVGTGAFVRAAFIVQALQHVPE